MASRKAPSEALMNALLHTTIEQELIAKHELLVNVEGEIPELVSKMTVPYECTVCFGKVMLEQEMLLLLNNIVGCPYCYEMRLVDDHNQYG